MKPWAAIAAAERLKPVGGPAQYLERARTHLGQAQQLVAKRKFRDAVTLAQAAQAEGEGDGESEAPREKAAEPKAEAAAEAEPEAAAEAEAKPEAEAEDDETKYPKRAQKRIRELVDEKKALEVEAVRYRNVETFHSMKRMSQGKNGFFLTVQCW